MPARPLSRPVHVRPPHGRHARIERGRARNLRSNRMADLRRPAARGRWRSAVRRAHASSPAAAALEAGRRSRRPSASSQSRRITPSRRRSARPCRVRADRTARGRSPSTLVDIQRAIAQWRQPHAGESSHHACTGWKEKWMRAFGEWQVRKLRQPRTQISREAMTIGSTVLVLGSVRFYCCGAVTGADVRVTGADVNATRTRSRAAPNAAICAAGTGSPGGIDRRAVTGLMKTPFFLRR